MNYTTVFSLCLVFLTAVVLAGCGDDAVSATCIDGSGTVATQPRSPGAFTGLIVSDNVDVILRQGPTEVLVEADDNFLPRIITELRGTKLFVGVDNSTCLRNGVARVYVTAPSLTGISTEGSGDVTGTAAFAPDAFSVTTIGSGDVQVTGATTRAVAVSIAGSGSVRLTGRATTLNAQLTGSGSLRAFELPVQEVMLTLTGSGSAEVNASSKLDVKLSGSGDVIYAGNPTIFSVITGSGTVRKKP